MQSLRQSRQVKLSLLLERQELFESRLFQAKRNMAIFTKSGYSFGVIEACAELILDYRNELTHIDKKITRIKRKLKEKN